MLIIGEYRPPVKTSSLRLVPRDFGRVKYVAAKVPPRSLISELEPFALLHHAAKCDNMWCQPTLHSEWQPFCPRCREEVSWRPVDRSG